ncbi:MAG: AAA family ATPase [Halanaerobiales bacterium]|nr:AAA family ATPase [Halanaerobiales bacterium]
MSEIRDSEIQELFEKVSNRNYGKYLNALEMVNIRGFKKQVVNFDFLVTAIIGLNGCGKTTVFGSAVSNSYDRLIFVLILKIQLKTNLCLIGSLICAIPGPNF